MVEQCTYSVYWPLFDSKNRDKTVRYRASFGLVPRKGEHMVVFKGKAFSYQDYTGRSVVVKGIRYYSGSTQDFKTYSLCNDQGRMIAQRFNKLLHKNSMKVRFVMPAVTTINQRAAITKTKKFERDEAVVFEEKLKGEFTTFVDKRGVAAGQHNLLLEAFCHFSFLASGKKFVICGLKGVQRKDMSEYTLTNPTIHSRKGDFGPKDKRDAGIEDFQTNHTCNKFCMMFLKETVSDINNASDEC